MKFILIAVLAVLAIPHARETGVRRFNGYQVLTVEVTTPEQAKIIKDLHDEGEHDFWTSPRRFGPTDIMGSPEQIKELIALFTTHGMRYAVKIEDVESLVQEERMLNKRNAEGRMDWVSYPRYAEIEEWLLTLESNDAATVTKIGETFESRNIYAVKISTGGSNKKAVLIDANIHAREWIAGATATWIINELTTNTSAYARILEEIDIYIIPFINVDGYEWAQTRDRLWRKTRSVRSGSACFGCDPNRNFGFQFGGESTSPNPCSDIYHGGEAFSESETVAVRDFIVGKEAEGVKFHAYMTFHSYAQLWLLPWGYTGGVYPEDYAEQLSLGQASIAALRAVHGTIYETGQGADMLYGVGGASDDWAKDHGIKYTATIEMRDTGRYGFVLPPTQIIPNAQEIWAALQVVFQRVVETQ